MTFSNMAPLSKSLGHKLQLAFLVFLFLGATSAQLSPTFYAASCPLALPIIKAQVLIAVIKEARMGASLLRLHFHDCFVNGCDGSVLLADTATFTGEQHSISNNNSLRGYDVVDTIKTKLELACPGVVSCADIVAVAARDSVVALGGLSYRVQLGRRDATTASITDANNNLPSPLLDLSGLQSLFSGKGFTDNELVALSGSHTIGQARCLGFRKRIYTDTNIDSNFAASRQANCPNTQGNGDSILAPLDSTATRFDNQYFKDLINLKGLLHSDQTLFGNQSTDSQVTAYSSSPLTFFTDFGNAMIKMGNLSPLTGSSGEIRKTCSKIN